MTQSYLLGETSQTLDKQNRVPLPVRFYADFAAGIVITRGLERCLMAFPLEEWHTLSVRVQGLPLVNALAREFQRLLFSGTSSLTLERSGHLPIPQHLREYAGLQHEVAIVGLGTHLEIWDLKTWQTKRDEFESQAANAEHWASLGV